jgi:hypothetical protein
MAQRKRTEFTPAEKLRFISMAIEEVARMREIHDKDYTPRTSLSGYACHFTSQPKLKPEDFEPMFNMTLREIIESEIDFPLTKEDFNNLKMLRKSNSFNYPFIGGGTNEILS